MWSAERRVCRAGAQELAIGAQVPENDERGDTKAAIRRRVVPNIVIIEEIRGLSVITRITARDRERCGRCASRLIDRE